MRCANCLTSLTNLFAMPSSMPISLSSLTVESCKVCNVIASFDNFCFASIKLAWCPGVLSMCHWIYSSIILLGSESVGMGEDLSAERLDRRLDCGAEGLENGLDSSVFV